MTPDAREAIVDRLVDNSCCWHEDDREELLELTDNQLLKLDESLTKELQAEAVVNAAREGFGLSNEITVNEMPAFIKEKMAAKSEEPTDEEEEEDVEEKPTGNALTKEQMDDIAFARSIKQERKDVAINAITANTNNKFSKEQLNEMPLEILQNMAELAKVPPQESKPYVPSYLGAAVPPTVNLTKDEENDFLPLPTVNWGEKESA